MTSETSAKTALRVTIGASFLLLAVLVLIQWTSGSFNLIILIAQMIPLALTLPGQFSKSSRSMQWLCFVVLFFLIQGILLAFTPGRMWAGLTETGICLILFFSAIIFIRASRKTA